MKICPRCSELFPDEAVRCAKDASDLRAVVDPLIGKTVGGRYRLMSRLGTGGMSSVYLARHVMIDRLLAIKTLRRDLAQDPIQRDRFIREARAVNRINHENIVEITDFGETEDGLVYLVMEHVPGVSLLHIMVEGPMKAARALPIARQVGLALSRAHQMGVIHRDLKPENILLVERTGRPDFVKILDFGIAKILDAPSLTASHQIFGTPGYIAPEYIQSAQIDGRADLYSLGVLLYELTTAALPFDYDYPGDLLVKSVTEEPVPPSRRQPSIERPLEELILRCLRKDPAERFRDAFHFLDELDSCNERLGSPALWGAMGSSTEPVRSEALGGRRAQPSEGRSLAETLPEGSLDAEPVPEAEQPAGAREPLDTIEDTRPEIRPVTQGYERPAIPEPPSVEAVSIPIDVEISVGSTDAVTAQPARAAQGTPPTPFEPQRDGLLGVKRWRRRFEAIRGLLDEIEVEQRRAASPEVTRAMAFASRTLEEFESCARKAEDHQAQVEDLAEQARDFRATLGKAMDSVAGKLSQHRGALAGLVARRDDLRDRREFVRKQMRAGEASEGDADALLWELAALEEEVRSAGGRCDDLELQLAELQGQLAQKNEEIEAGHARVKQVLDGEMARLEAMAASLREPLELAERFVTSHWDASPRRGRPPPPPRESV